MKISRLGSFISLWNNSFYLDNIIYFKENYYIFYLVHTNFRFHENSIGLEVCGKLRFLETCRPSKFDY
ncbi:hypothetical protein H5410_003536 [Solanum commersonii]|uniref:Uncharacterized protein n=1 Tax=Solanum commersonii TaxID=4109 RepID=A0A9J6B5C8_SOLCO|nr:hypothetical protein H5410_003536 [Solanum commersonii]